MNAKQELDSLTRYSGRGCGHPNFLYTFKSVPPGEPDLVRLLWNDFVVGLRQKELDKYRKNLSKRVVRAVNIPQPMIESFNAMARKTSMDLIRKREVDALRHYVELCALQEMINDVMDLNVRMLGAFQEDVAMLRRIDNGFVPNGLNERLKGQIKDLETFALDLVAWNDLFEIVFGHDITKRQSSDGRRKTHETHPLIGFVTSKVVLEGHDLGQFIICFSPFTQDDYCIRAFPLQPNRPLSSNEVCHPHVRANSLCTGDSLTTILTAFRAGRVFDAFDLTNKVIHSWSSVNPYMDLSQWRAPSCIQCRAMIDDCPINLEDPIDDPSLCLRCGYRYCRDCRKSQSCLSCGHTCCRRHQRYCSFCAKSLCDHCRDAEAFGRNCQICCLDCEAMANASIKFLGARSCCAACFLAKQAAKRETGWLRLFPQLRHSAFPSPSLIIDKELTAHGQIIADIHNTISTDFAKQHGLWGHWTGERNPSVYSEIDEIVEAARPQIYAKRLGEIGLLARQGSHGDRGIWTYV